MSLGGRAAGGESDKNHHQEQGWSQLSGGPRVGKPDCRRAQDIGGSGDPAGFPAPRLFTALRAAGFHVDGEGLCAIAGREPAMGGY